MISKKLRPIHLLITVCLSFAILLCYTGPSYASPDSDNARNQAQDILKDSKYGNESDKPLEKDIDRLGNWLGEGDKDIKTKRDNKQIKKQYSQDPPKFTPPAIAGLSLLAKIGLMLLALGTITAIGLLIYKIIADRESKKKDEETEEDIDITLDDIDWENEEHVLEYISDADKLELLSNEAEKNGRLDIALRYRFRAGLLRLNDNGRIRFDRSTTNAQWQLELSDNNFDELTNDFNDITYGHYSCNTDLLEKSKSKWKVILGK